MDRNFILETVRRTAAENGSVALGRLRLESEAGVKEHHWKKFWARYSELVAEAGLTPNKTAEAWTADQLTLFLCDLARSIGRFPTHADIRVKSNEEGFPNHRVFDRTLGTKAEKVAKVAAYCRTQGGYDDVLAMCEAVAEDPTPSTSKTKATTPDDGFVYMMKSGRIYKIGRSVHAGARERQLQIQLPERVATVHVITTDDPAGIEAYWHQRFATRRKNGEWFDLSASDIAAFRRRKFM